MIMYLYSTFPNNIGNSIRECTLYVYVQKLGKNILRSYTRDDIWTILGIAKTQKFLFLKILIF